MLSKIENDMPKPTDRRRLLLRGRFSRDSDWTSTIPSAYEISFLNSTSEPHEENATTSIKFFNRYVEGQRSPRGHRGCKSLKDMAIEMLLKNLSDIDDLNHLPKHLARYMWHTLKRRCMLSFHSWRVLSKALYREEDDASLGMFQYSKSIQCSKCPLHFYIQPLISETFDFITSLSINIKCTMVDLVRLTKISNLGILEIINPNPSGETSSGVGDIILRTWSREAKESGAFSVLRILRLWHHQDLTEKSLQHIRSFPALAIFDLRYRSMDGCEKMVHEAEKIGWTTTGEADLLHRLEKKCQEKQKAMFATSGGLVSQRAERSFDKALWPDSRVRRIEKSNIQSFLAHFIEDNVAVCPDHVKDGADGGEEWVSKSWDIFCKTRHKNSWESDLAALWARIGELREDCDLKAAGIGDIERTFAGPQTISPVPMVYIRLTDVHQSLKQDREETSVIFISKSMNQPTTSNRDSQSELKSSHFRRRSIENQTGGSLGKLRPLKRQKLEDILNDFNYG